MNTEKLKPVLSEYLSTRLGTRARAENIFSLTGGACQDNYSVDVFVEDGEQKGEHRLVLRTDKGGSLLRSLTRFQEYEVVEKAHAAGVNTPRPYWLEKNPEIIGNPFYFMQRITGNASGRFIVKDRSLHPVRAKIAGALAENLARIHSITPQKASFPFFETPDWNSDKRAVALAAVADCRNMLDTFPAGYPGIELVLNWLEAHAPETDSLVLVHGDFRTGNFMADETGLTGIVDWEFAHWGDRHEDIAWIRMRDWRFGKVNREIGGFADPADFYPVYEKASGFSLNPEIIRYWEIMGNVRWAIGAAQQGERHLSGQDRGIEFASIGRRVCEMEFEAMRLAEEAAG